MNRIVSTALPDGRLLHRMALLVVAAALVLGAGAGWARPAPDSFANLAAKLLPAVVNISSTQVIKRGAGAPQMPRLPPGSPFEEFFKEFFDRQQRQNQPNRRSTSLGSGFVIDSSGLVVTNNHVIAGAEEITVITHDDVRLKAEIVGRDAKTDLAVLRVKPAKPMRSVVFGDSDRSRVGDWVLAIGNPFGLGGTVTAGIISARARNINAGPYDDFIQTDASINRGNSGGPMFNMDGGVIGINTAIFSPSGGSVGIGFSIPSNLAKPLIDQLVKFGRARRGWLGVRIQTVTEELADSLGLDRAQGALVANITPGGPAEKGKIKVGDVILKFDGKPIHEMRTLPRVVAETAVGKQVKVVIWRLGSEVKLTTALGEFPEDDKLVAARPATKPSKGGAVSIEPLGLTLSRLNNDLRGKFKLADTVKGVVVTEVADDSPSAKKGVRPGDIVRRIGSSQDEVKSPGQVSATVRSARKAKNKTVLFLFERDGNSRFVALGLGKS